MSWPPVANQEADAYMPSIADSGSTAQASVAESSVVLPPVEGAQPMTTLPFPLRPDASAFDPETIKILNDAFESAWQALHTSGTTSHLGGQEEQTSEMLARCIIELAKLNERDPRRLRDAALAHLAEANIRRGRD
jgi:hypothetical protein